MAQYKIPCKHETGEVLCNVTVSDYYPLTQSEIADLLYAAKQAMLQYDDQMVTQTVASIQCRLGQGIKGMVCPHEIEGDVAQRLNHLNSLYVSYVKGHLPEYSDQEIAEILWELMQSGE